MQRAKEAASNVAASAKSGMEKTKATMEEKAEKMATRDPARKEMAAEKRDERYQEAELGKQGAYDQNAAAKQTRGVGQGFTTGGGRAGEDYPAGGTGAFEGAQYPSGANTGSRATTGTTGTHGTRRPSDDEPDIVTPNVGFDAGPTF
ncbi:OLC1v1033868C1 [Oldenlandia corymbosa var. corymbosa]|uniref:OLC1v1033868C1 n=1 Tax=Oldenlandia corymbosa var. corymbosa TaxID=529605 RepID=A0AAV1CS63_OLDCO|nr:OLC1v1033868C1 [Oldenlandia corymbosa var. corymbosa]